MLPKTSRCDCTLYTDVSSGFYRFILRGPCAVDRGLNPFARNSPNSRGKPAIDYVHHLFGAVFG